MDIKKKKKKKWFTSSALYQVMFVFNSKLEPVDLLIDHLICVALCVFLY